MSKMTTDHRLPSHWTVLLTQLFVCALFSDTARAQNVSVSLKSPSVPGLRVFSAADPAVRAFTSSVVGSTLPDSSQLLPFSLVVDNATGQTIIAYTLRLSYVDKDGHSGGHNRTYFNFDYVSNGMELPSGSMRLVTPLVSLGSTTSVPSQRSSTADARSNDVSDLANYLHTQAAIVTALDLVVLEDGTVFGPDEGGTLSYLQSFLIAEREVAALVDRAVREKRSLLDVAVALEQQARDLTANRGVAPYANVARASQVTRFAGLCKAPHEVLLRDIQRVLTKKPLTLRR
jgi:hypothetical protein